MNDNKFRMLIRPGYFAPTLYEFKDSRPVHSLAFGKCNYRCAFCYFDKWTVDRYPEFTSESFEQKVWELLKISKNFKFTGGEPTLNPQLEKLLEIVKLYGAKVYLDTNGSRPEVIRKLTDKGLVDILGLSLKGVTSAEAASNAGITNEELSFDKVFESLDVGSKAENVRVIVTYVACEGHFCEETFEELYRLLKPYPEAVLKINNCYHEDMLEGRRRGMEKTELCKLTEVFVAKHPDYKGRVVLFRDHDACVDSEKIMFF